MVGIKSKVGEKGQITIPKELREHFNILSGDTVELDDKNGQIIIRKVEVDIVKMFSEFRKKHGALFTKSEFNRINWSKLHDERMAERHAR